MFLLFSIVYGAFINSTTQICKLGGMFGSSLSGAEALGTYMAVGEPYKNSVHIYVKKDEWILMQTIQEDLSFPLSLFGYSVSLSPDAQYLVVGAPGSAPKASSPSLHGYYGVVRIFRLQNQKYIFDSEIKNEAMNFNDAFGSKVLILQKGRVASSERSLSSLETMYTILISLNGGWDGVSAPGLSKTDTNVLYKEKDWPMEPTTQQKQGVAVYQGLVNFTKTGFISSSSMGLRGVVFDACYSENIYIAVASFDSVLLYSLTQDLKQTHEIKIKANDLKFQLHNDLNLLISEKTKISKFFLNKVWEKRGEIIVPNVNLMVPCVYRDLLILSDPVSPLGFGRVFMVTDEVNELLKPRSRDQFGTKCVCFSSSCVITSFVENCLYEYQKHKKLWQKAVVEKQSSKTIFYVLIGCGISVLTLPVSVYFILKRHKNKVKG